MTVFIYFLDLLVLDYFLKNIVDLHSSFLTEFLLTKIK